MNKSNIKSVYFKEKDQMKEVKYQEPEKHTFSRDCCKQFFCSDSYHPFATFLHISFAVMAVLFFLFKIDSLTSLSFLISIIQFWLVKNVFGRKMAGLNWGFSQDSYQQICWRLQGWLDETNKKNPFQTFVFWTVLVAQLLGWLTIMIIHFLQITRTVMAFAQVIIIAVNLYCFIKAYRCKQPQPEVKQKVQQLRSKFGQQFIHKKHDFTVVVLTF